MSREELRLAQAQKIERAQALEKALIAKKLEEMKEQMFNLVDRMHTVLRAPVAADIYQRANATWLGQIELALMTSGSEAIGIGNTIAQLKGPVNQETIRITPSLDDVLDAVLPLERVGIDELVNS